MSAVLPGMLDQIDALLDVGDYTGAFQSIAGALKSAPGEAALWIRLGRLYLRLNQLVDAAQAFDRVRQLAPDQSEAWLALAALRESAGDAAGAITIYREAIAQNIDDPALVLGLAACLKSVGLTAEAETGLLALLAREPGQALPWRVLGEVRDALGRPAEAAEAYARSLALDDRVAAVHHNLGLAREASGDRRGAIAAMMAALERDPECWPALAQVVFLKRQCADWSDLDALSARLRAAVRDERPGLTPFSFLSEPATPAEQLACARRWGQLQQDEAARLAFRLPPWRPTTRSTDAPIRIGFVSSGFHNHPTALLIVDLIERLHDSGLSTYGFATAPGDSGTLRQRLAAGFHTFADLSTLDPAAMAVHLRAAELDLVFDLRGYGGGSVSPVFALRVAPVQVNWLAYPGSQGAPFMDYLLADPYVAPDAERIHYSETLVRLPHCFQPSDSTRRIAPPPPRVECGLPEHGPVLASFNNSYKIAPEVFEAWMAILRRAPEATLWLLQSGPEAMAVNLRHEAAVRGVDPGRLRFMARLPHPEYLARYCHVDLFLDTWPYNAHTTASDALFAGCPVLTLPGRSFAARVAGSLLTTLGLDQLIASDSADYVERAVALVSDDEARAALRARLVQARRDSPLFDMRRFASDFAVAVRWMVERQRQGLPPTDHDL